MRSSITDRIALHSVHYKMRALLGSLNITALTNKFERKNISFVNETSGHLKKEL